MESQDARSEEPQNDLLMPGADRDALGVGPGNVPERDDGRPRQPSADHGRRQGEVIVLYENDRILGIDLLAYGRGEFLVDSIVVFPVLRAERGPGVRHVAQWPDPFVGEPVVVALLLLFTEPDSPDHV